ncbi:hypothetical protein PHET_10824 [Paragonimus heterotremus]|uniref:Glycoside hydrolase family 38 N-terminal domain-containing protein n=1 Tax=Paragonimus heterotremus TaxID=100268 RepID=A0A8J4T624_9TREM|nr:hypothetical protein PHET_10824 [Paragonimus heterotremus]
MHSPFHRDDRNGEPGHGVVDSPNYPRNNAPNALKGDLKVSAIYEALEFKNSPGGVWKQGFPIQCSDGALKQKPVEVFIVPHSHQDPGWVRTFEEYFIEKTKPCLDSTLKILQKRPEARFTYAEMSFFSMWVEGLTQDEKHQVKRLLDNGQLEVTSGGWVMTDEATAHHYGMLDQLIEGHHWLLDTFSKLAGMIRVVKFLLFEKLWTLTIHRFIVLCCTLISETVLLLHECLSPVPMGSAVIINLFACLQL